MLPNKMINALSLVYFGCFTFSVVFMSGHTTKNGTKSPENVGPNISTSHNTTVTGTSMNNIIQKTSKEEKEVSLFNISTNPNRTVTEPSVNNTIQNTTKDEKEISLRSRKGLLKLKKKLINTVFGKKSREPARKCNSPPEVVCRKVKCPAPRPCQCHVVCSPKEDCPPQKQCPSPIVCPPRVICPAPEKCPPEVFCPPQNICPPQRECPPQTICPTRKSCPPQKQCPPLVVCPPEKKCPLPAPCPQIYCEIPAQKPCPICSPAPNCPPPSQIGSPQPPKPCIESPCQNPSNQPPQQIEDGVYCAPPHVCVLEDYDYHPHENRDEHRRSPEDSSPCKED